MPVSDIDPFSPGNNTDDYPAARLTQEEMKGLEEDLCTNERMD